MFGAVNYSEKYRVVVLNTIIMILLICMEYGHSRRMCKVRESARTDNPFKSCIVVEKPIYSASLATKIVSQYDNYKNIIFIGVSLDTISSANQGNLTLHSLSFPHVRSQVLVGMELISGAVPMAIENFCKETGDLNFTFV